MSQINPILNAKGRTLAIDKPLVMGILNLTPDSFYDGGKYVASEEMVVNRVKEMVEHGADIIDIGAASSRPGATIINPIEEQNRILPFFPTIREAFPKIWISIDTYHSSTAKLLLEQGANIINDISAGSIDKKMFEIVGEFQCPYILMHMQGKPANMQKNPQYNNVTQEVISFFRNKIASLKKYGVKEIILDPGFGFGKTVEHNFELLKNLKTFEDIFGFPIMTGISRKSMINKVIGTKPEDALNGTTALNMLALMNGASILRVHDVKEAKETVQLFEKYKSTQ